MVQFKRVMIANRGEIAVRVIHALDTLGIESVAVYSDADELSPHVSMADRAYNLPGVYPADTYLNAEELVNIALKSECDGIHPGYGFLSESSDFSRLCNENSIKFIGPGPETLELSGNKLECKKLVESENVPVIPYSKRPIPSSDEAAEFASSLGYPVLLKSAFGGGGRGIKEARSKLEVKEAFESSKREAKSSFGRFSIFIEKKITRPRHIEIQILASEDSTELLHLGERECSIQRRYQKLIELSPSPVVDEDTRAEVTGYALKAAKAVGYSNAGTVEFLRDSETGEFFFIEINSRLQVEHPVTEAVTGIDLVASQIAIASTGKLPLRQKDVTLRGSAIECRINAEDPMSGFAPASGTIEYLSLPSGPGIRVDTGLREGVEISPYYDSLIAKLVSWGEDFQQARRRAVVALDDFVVYGIGTTIPFCRKVLTDESFTSGELHTGFIEERQIIQKLKDEEKAVEPHKFAIAALLLSKNQFQGKRGLSESLRQQRRFPIEAREPRGGRFVDAL